LRPTKTATRRTVDIVEPLRDDLEQLRKVAPNGAVLAAPNREGRPLDLRTWRRRIWKPACERAGVSLTPYDLRHGYCSLLAHEGRSAPYIAAMLGHSLTDTQKHYAHIIDAARLAPGVPMVDAIRAARESRNVRPRYALAARRHLAAVG
jgi:integrase